MKILTYALIGLVVVLALAAGGFFVHKTFFEKKQPVSETVSIETVQGDNVEDISPPPPLTEEVVEEPKPQPKPKPVVQPKPTPPPPKPVVIAKQVEPEPEPKPMEDPYDETSKVFPPKPYAIQISSNEIPEMAQKTAAGITAKGFTACWTPIITGDSTIYRIYVGMYPTLAEAKSAERKMKDQGVIPADSYPIRVPYALMIGSSESLKSAEKLKQKLVGMGYSAYIQSSDSGNSFRVMVGAYESANSAKDNLGKVLSSDHLEYVVTDR